MVSYIVNSKYHINVVNFVENHPIYKTIFDDSFMRDLSDRWSQKSPRFPGLYCAILEETRCNLKTFEAGFRFVSIEVKGQPKSDLISRLRDPKNVGSVFEVTLIGSLILEFGGCKITPYPKLDDGKRAELSIESNGQNIFIEASVLSFSEKDNQAFEQARLNDGVSVVMLPGTGEGRVIKKIEEKMQRYARGFPNIFLLSQSSCLPRLDFAIKAVESYFKKYGHTSPTCNYSGIFYFDRFQVLKWIENIGSDKCAKIQEKTISHLKKAFCRMLSLPLPNDPTH